MTSSSQEIVVVVVVVVLVVTLIGNHMVIMTNINGSQEQAGVGWAYTISPLVIIHRVMLMDGWWIRKS